MKATIQIILFARVLENGTRPVMLRATFARKVRMFPLKRYALPENWDKLAGRFLRGHQDYKQENEVLRSYEQRAADAVRSFELDHSAFTFDKFEDKVFGSGRDASLTAGAYVLSICDDLRASGNLGNAALYKHCSRHLLAYKSNATLGDIDGPWLVAFERFMRNKRGTGGGGMSVVMRTLRAACKRAAKTGVMPKSFQPFDDYSIAHLKGDGAKKAISLEEIRAIESMDLPRRLEFARDLFLLSFYLRGMNLADMAEITVTSIKGGRLTYKRKKTGGVFSLAVTEKAAAIFDKYANCDAVYLLPIFMSGVHVSPQQKKDRINKVTKEINPAIREAAGLVGIDTENLTFYSARHSYATALERKGVSRVMISQALGHKSLSTTEGYLKEFGDRDIDAADELLS